MSSFAAARSVLRSAAGRTALGSRISSIRSKPASSPFCIPKPNQSRLSRPTLRRSAVEMSRCVESMLPCHTAMASALLTSMLSVSRRTYSWTPEGAFDEYKELRGHIGIQVAPFHSGHPKNHFAIHDIRVSNLQDPEF